jgi:hypothetical protein
MQVSPQQVLRMIVHPESTDQEMLLIMRGRSGFVAVFLSAKDAVFYLEIKCQQPLLPSP